MEGNEPHKIRDGRYFQTDVGSRRGIGKGTQEASKVLAMFLKVGGVYAEVHFIVIAYATVNVF